MKKTFLIYVAIIFLFPHLSNAAMVEGVDWAWDATTKHVVWLKNTPTTAYNLAVSSLSSQRSFILNEPYGVRSAASYAVEDSLANRITSSTLSTMGKSLGSNLVAGLVMGAAFSVADNYIDWLIAQGQDPALHKKNNLPYKYIEGEIPTPGCNNAVDPSYIVQGTYKTESAATAAWSAGLPAVCKMVNGVVSYPCGEGTNGTLMYCTSPNVWGKYGRVWVEAHSMKVWVWLWYTGATGTTYEVIATQDDVKKALENAYANDPTKWMNAVNDALGDISNALKGLNATLLAATNKGSGERTFPNAISTVYNSMNATNITTVTNTLTNNSEDINTYNYITQASNADNAVTPDQIRLAVEGAMQNVLGSDVDVPAANVDVIPEKLNLTEKLTSFMSSIGAVPLVNTMRGLTINAGGSSVVCMDLPANMGGTKCFNCSDWQGSLNYIGSILLAVTTLMSFVYVFRG